ncbi:hypothetical protein [Methanobrevibacter sp.]|uniref:hypothetical protein n=1 Tax=Methanobrevibacter sp. TaxID=66852 RepID=UPI00388F7F9E
MKIKAVDENVRKRFPSHVKELEKIQELKAEIARLEETIKIKDELLRIQEEKFISIDELLAEKDLDIKKLRQDLDIAKNK